MSLCWKQLAPESHSHATLSAELFHQSVFTSAWCERLPSPSAPRNWVYGWVRAQGTGTTYSESRTLLSSLGSNSEDVEENDSQNGGEGDAGSLIAEYERDFFSSRRTDCPYESAAVKVLDTTTPEGATRSLIFQV